MYETLTVEATMHSRGIIIFCTVEEVVLIHSSIDIVEVSKSAVHETLVSTQEWSEVDRRTCLLAASNKLFKSPDVSNELKAQAQHEVIPPK